MNIEYKKIKNVGYVHLLSPSLISMQTDSAHLVEAVNYI